MKESKLNREWHAEHAMPRNPTREQGVEWHAEHAAHCGCRDVPAGLADEVRARNDERRSV